MPQHARTFAEGVLKSTVDDLELSSSSAAAAAAATREGIPALCRALGMPEPQNFAAACRSLHCADGPAACSPPEFSASDVRFAMMIVIAVKCLFFYRLTFYACANFHQKGSARGCVSSSS